MRVIKRPVMSEKAVRLMESDNILTIIVNERASKRDIKRVVEELFKVKVLRVNTLITTKNEKKAYVKLSPESSALDVGTELGMI